MTVAGDVATEVGPVFDWPLLHLEWPVRDRPYFTLREGLKSGVRGDDIATIKDPLFNKLKSDACIVLNDLLRALAHRPDQPKWRSPRENRPAPETAMLKPVAPRDSKQPTTQ